MSPRVARNTIVVLIVILYMALMLLIGGCTTIKMERSVDGSEKITVRAPPKDFRALDFQWHETSLRAGEAATAEQPWADVAVDAIGVIGPLLLNVNAYCTAYPVMCADYAKRDAPEYTPEIIRRAEVYCRAYPGMCVN